LGCGAREAYDMALLPSGSTSGSSNAQASFQAMVNRVFLKHLDQSVVVSLKDMLIFLRSSEEHEQHTHQVLGAVEGRQASRGNRKGGCGCSGPCHPTALIAATAAPHSVPTSVYRAKSFS